MDDIYEKFDAEQIEYLMNNLEDLFEDYFDDDEEDDD